MEDWIAGTFAVLGTLMVLAGASLLVMKTLGRLSALPDADTQPLDGTLRPGQAVPASEPTTADSAPRRITLRRPSLPTQLIGWGIVLLLLAAITVDLIVLTFSVGTPSGTP